MTLSWMIISTISDQTDPPLSGVITNTVFGPNTFSASETSWLMPLIDVIFVDIQTPLGKNIFDTIHFFKTQHYFSKFIFHSDSHHTFPSHCNDCKKLSRPTTIPQNWRRQRFLIPTHLPLSSSSGWWWGSCFYFSLFGEFPLRIPGAVSEPHCSWHIRTADFALLLGLRALSSWGFSLVVFLFHPKTKFTWDTFFGNEEIHCSFRNYLVMASSVIAWVACLSFECYRVVILKSSKTVLMVSWARVLLIDHLNLSI